MALTLEGVHFDLEVNVVTHLTQNLGARAVVSIEIRVHEWHKVSVILETGLGVEAQLRADNL